MEKNVVNMVNVKYISVWDGGYEVETNAKYNTELGFVYDVETTDENIEELEVLEREYVRFEDGTEIELD